MPYRIMPQIPELEIVDGGSNRKPSMQKLPFSSDSPSETPRTQLANMVYRFTPAPGSTAKTFQKYRALVPNCVVEKYLEAAMQVEDTSQLQEAVKIREYAEEFWGAVLFADISGFSKLAEKLQKDLGESAAAAETLSRYVGDSLDIMVKMITSNHGDVIKFAGDAILAVFPARSFGGDNAAATLRCCQVGLKLAKLELVAGPQRLSVHCGLGVGDMIGYHVGGVNNRWEYTITGDPIAQIGSAEPEAEAGQLVISEASILWLQRGLLKKLPKQLRRSHTLSRFQDEEDKPTNPGKDETRTRASSTGTKEDKDASALLTKGLPFDGTLMPSGNFLLLSIEVAMHSLKGKSKSTSTLEAAQQEEKEVIAAMEKESGDSCGSSGLSRADSFMNASTPSIDIINGILPVLRNYIPRPVLIALDAGHSIWSSQFYRVTTLFIRLSGLSYSNAAYLAELQRIIRAVQRDVYSFYGTLCRYIVDDKGSGILVAFGLPPFEQSENQPLRGVKCALAIHSTMETMSIGCSIGVTTGRVFVGMVGGNTRCEYTLHGSLVNLAARLMVAAKDGVLISNRTFEKSQSVRTIHFEGPSFIKVKSYVEKIPVYRPQLMRAEIISYKEQISLKRQRNRLQHAVPLLVDFEAQSILQESYHALTRHNIGGLLSVEGEAGTGKTMVCEHIACKAVDEKNYDVCIYEASAIDMEQETPYFIWRIVLTQMFNLAKYHGARQKRWEHLLKFVPDDLKEIAPVLRDIFPDITCENKTTLALFDTSEISNSRIIETTEDEMNTGVNTLSSASHNLSSGQVGKREHAILCIVVAMIEKLNEVQAMETAEYNRERNALRKELEAKAKQDIENKIKEEMKRHLMLSQLVGEMCDGVSDSSEDEDETKEQAYSTSKMPRNSLSSEHSRTTRSSSFGQNQRSSKLLKILGNDNAEVGFQGESKNDHSKGSKENRQVVDLAEVLRETDRRMPPLLPRRYICIFEDMQWADTMSLHLIKGVLCAMPSQMLFVVTTRPAQADALASKPALASPALQMKHSKHDAFSIIIAEFSEQSNVLDNQMCECIKLGKLNLQQIKQVVMHTMDTQDVDKSLLELLLKHVRGQPMFTIELVKHMKHKNTIIQSKQKKKNTSSQSKADIKDHGKHRAVSSWKGKALSLKSSLRKTRSLRERKDSADKYENFVIVAALAKDIDPHEIELPDDIATLMTSRLGKLQQHNDSERLQLVLKLASAIGMYFTVELLCALAPSSIINRGGVVIEDPNVSTINRALSYLSPEDLAHKNQIASERSESKEKQTDSLEKRTSVSRLLQTLCDLGYISLVRSEITSEKESNGEEESVASASKVIYESESKFRFQSQTLRQAAYEQMLYEHRRNIHGRIGDFLSVRLNIKMLRGDSNEPRMLRLIAHHYYKARDSFRAIPALLAAGDNAMACSDHPMAYSCFDRLLRICGNLYVDSSEVVRKPWSRDDRERGKPNEYLIEDSGQNEHPYISRLRRASWGRKIGSIKHLMGDDTAAECHFWLALAALGIKCKSGVVSTVKRLVLGKSMRNISGGSLAGEKNLQKFISKHKLAPAELIEASLLYSMIARHSLQISKTDRECAFQRAVRLAEAAASSTNSSTKFDLKSLQGKAGDDSQNLAKYPKIAVAIRAAEFGTYFLCQLRKKAKASERFQLARKTLSMIPSGGSSKHILSAIMRVNVHLISEKLEAGHIHDAKKILSPAAPDILRGIWPSEAYYRLPKSDFDVGEATLLLCLSISRFVEEPKDFLSRCAQSVLFDRDSSCEGGNHVSDASILEAMPCVPRLVQHVMLYAAYESGNLDLCVKMLCGDSSVLDIEEKNSRRVDRDSGISTISGEHMRRESGLSMSSKTSSVSLGEALDRRNRRNSQFVFGARGSNQSEIFLGDLLHSTKFKRQDHDSQGSEKSELSIYNISQAARISYALVAKLRKKKSKSASQEAGFSSEKAHAEAKAESARRVSRRLSSSISKRSMDTTKIGMLVDITSAYSILSTTDVDPLVLAPVLSICLLRGDYISTIQVGTVVLSYLDMERPASPVLPRFHSFCMCATVVSMAFFCYSVPVSDKTEYKQNESKSEECLGDENGYIKRLKARVKTLKAYGIGMKVTCAHVTYMNSWWHLANGNVAKAIAGFRSLAPSPHGNAVSDDVYLTTQISLQATETLLQLESTSTKSAIVRLKSTDRARFLEKVILANDRGWNLSL